MNYFQRHREHGLFFIRLIVGFHLTYGTADNVFSSARMLEFSEFLAARGVPLPLVAAHVSAYAQFLCGILFIAGAFVRPAAAVMIVNFICALAIAHRTGGLADTIRDGLTGFLFGDLSLSGLKGAIRRAFDAFNADTRFAEMRRHAMSQSFGWEQSANAYGALYRGG